MDSNASLDSVSLDSASVDEQMSASGAAAVVPPILAGGHAAQSTAVDGSSAERSHVAPSPDDESPDLMTFTRAAMLAAGVLTLLAVRRRNQLRRARPRSRLPIAAPESTMTERAFRAVASESGTQRICSVLATISDDLLARGERFVAALVGDEGDVEFRFSGPVDLAPPWQGVLAVWRLPGSDSAAPSAGADRADSLVPTLVQLGRADDGRDVFVDLEACAAIEIGGSSEQADAIVASIALTLASSPLAEVTTMIGLGVADEAFLGHRLHIRAHDTADAFRSAAEAIGTTATAGQSTFAFAGAAGSVEAWEPAVVLSGSGSGAIPLPVVPTGLAVVSASPIVGPSWRLAPESESWSLRPLDIRLSPIGVAPDELGSIAELVDVDDPWPLLVLPFQPDSPAAGEPTQIEHPADSDADADADVDSVVVADASIVASERLDPWEVVTSVWRPTPPPPWELMVRLFGPVEVISRSGDAVEFERSKTRELVAWLATHRTRSTRTAARTALWELDVRDSTFSNVVSEAAPGSGEAGRAAGGRGMGRPHDDRGAAPARTGHHRRRPDPPGARDGTAAAAGPGDRHLTPAVALINGMAFEGTAYLWPDAEGITSNLVLLATSAAAELAAHCLSVGDIEGVYQATWRGLQVLPGQEELIGLRMQARAAAGDHAGLRQEWESYERVITSDPWSDGEPSSELVELRQRLLR